MSVSQIAILIYCTLSLTFYLTFRICLKDNENQLKKLLKIHFSLYSYRLILASVLITSKFYNDIFYGNHFVAYVGGVSLDEMNLLELEFLS